MVSQYMEISLPAEKVFTLFGFSITNSIFTGWLVTLLIIILALVIRASLSKVPGRRQSVVELIYDYFYSNAVEIIGREDIARAVFPLIMTLFFFILFSNWLGLLPGFGTIGIHHLVEGKDNLIPLLRAPTSDLNTTIALGLCTVAYIQYVGLKYTGFKTYIGKFINLKGPIEFFVGLVEILSEFTRILSFAFRLFGNIFAGEVLLAVMYFLMISLVPYVAILPLPFYLVELFVGLIQAFIFCFLTLVFIALAVTSHDDDSHAENAVH